MAKVPAPATPAHRQPRTSDWTCAVSSGISFSRRLSPLKGILNPNSIRVRARAAASSSQVSTKGGASSCACQFGSPTPIFLRVSYFENELSSILALEELQQRFGEYFEPLYDVLARFEFASRHPRRHLPCGLRVTISVVEHDHTFHAGAINKKREIVRGSFDWCGIAVLRDCTADDYSCAARELRERSVEY